MSLIRLACGLMIKDNTDFCLREVIRAIARGDHDAAKWWGMRLYRHNRPTWWAEAYN